MVSVQHNSSRQNLAEKLTSPRTFHLECMCEAEIKCLSRGWGLVLEDYLLRGINADIVSSKLSHRIFSRVLLKITAAFHHMMQYCSLTDRFINQFSLVAV